MEVVIINKILYDISNLSPFLKERALFGYSIPNSMIFNIEYDYKIVENDYLEDFDRKIWIKELKDEIIMKQPCIEIHNNDYEHIIQTDYTIHKVNDLEKYLKQLLRKKKLQRLIK